MKNPRIYLIFLFFVYIFQPLLSWAKDPKPKIQLANIYHKNIDIKNYLVSEKLDGVRAYWDGKNLISREGNVFNAPQWFVKDFPIEHLEGELWIARGKFEELSGIVRKQNPDESSWRKVRLMLFDMPQHHGIFVERLAAMKELVAKVQSPYLQIIEQSTFLSHEELKKHLEKLVKNGAEGLMLHRANSFYQAQRNDDLLKLKTYEDEEAVVIAHIAGNGKFSGMMGAMLVENRDKIRFKIGSGFSETQRKSPPKIGSVITYKFYGKTKNNRPRFPSFLRSREEIKNFENVRN